MIPSGYVPSATSLNNLAEQERGNFYQRILLFCGTLLKGYLRVAFFICNTSPRQHAGLLGIISTHILMSGVSMFFGLFIIAAGIISLLENFGVIAGDVKWGLPLAIICFGASIVYDAVKGKKKD